MKENTSTDELKILKEDLKLVKNDVNVIKSNTQISANLLSLIHGNDIKDIVFTIVNNERLCKALLLCGNPMTAKELCNELNIKASNIRKQIIDKLIDASFLIVVDKIGQSETYKRAGFLDMIGFEKLAKSKYPNIVV